MSDTLFSQVLAQAHVDGDAVRYPLPEDWGQGRSCYGGLQTALSLDVAQRQVDELPPLRSALVSFLGPAAGELVVRTRVRRRGRSVVFVGSDGQSDAGPALHCEFAFGANRPSAHDACFAPAPSVAPPEQCEAFVDFEHAPSFTRHFESRLARGGRPGTSSKESEILLWVRHKDPDATSMAAMLALSDMPPPAVLPMFDTLAPTSSMTWALNLVDPRPENPGWRLVCCRAEHVRDGYSSQDMFLWNEDGSLAMTGRQAVAVFA